MSSFVFAPPPVASLAVANSADRFPIRRVICVGRNYAAHAREMGKDPDREPPFFFMKPADTVLDAKGTVPYPPETSDFQYEIELVVGIGQGGTNVTPAAANGLIWGYGVGIDLTRRDLQLLARDAGRPWEWGKAFDKSAPCGPLYPREQTGVIDHGHIWLTVNGETRQEADISDLIWSVPEIISTISRSMALAAGDLIMTGTPAGVGAIEIGDVVRGGIDGLGTIEIVIGAPDVQP